MKALSRRDKADTRVRQLSNVGEHIERRATEAIEFPDHASLDLATTRGLHDAAQAT
jgi:hypothetical protein